MQPVGTSWLVEHFKLPTFATTQSSQIGGRRQRLQKPDGRVDEIFTRSYWPGDHPLNHVEFLLKYEPLCLDLLEQVFQRLTPAEVDKFIAGAPTGRFRRRIGFLYECLTFHQLSVKVSGNYLPLLDPKRYFTGTERSSSRWRITDNLLGSAGFCPIIRRTPHLEERLRTDWSARIRELTGTLSAQLLHRAVNYLYLKETKASFAIEREALSADRTERFVQVLARAGATPAENLLDEQRLAALQNLIVDPRYAETAFRRVQNYVGETLIDYTEKVHYVCPPPELVKTLFVGLRNFQHRSTPLPPPLRAAVVSFGFVYAHPFLDGNGRLHRLLLHESLAFDKYTGPGVVLPFSAVMLRDAADYTRVLETFSRFVNSRVSYQLNDRGELTIQNPRSVAGLWRYPDYTPHVEYVLDLIAATVTRDLPDELRLLEHLDRAARSIKEVLDLPNQRLNLLLRLLHQNRGKLSTAKRKGEFPELTDDELVRIEAAFASAFELSA